MSSIASTVSMYNFTPSQANVLGAPVSSSMFGEIDQVYTRDNASTKAHFGLSTPDSMSYDAANYYFFNETLSLGVDCGRVNAAGGRPDLTVATTGGSACYLPSISAQKAAKAINPNYNSFSASAEELVLAEGDIRYAPSRFADQNNYNGSSISDASFQPRLMGTRDAAPSGCTSTNLDQSLGGLSSCSLADNPLPYPFNTDPRVGYDVDSPHTNYWSPLDLLGAVPTGCELMGDMSVCDLGSVMSSGPTNLPPQYGMRIKR